MKKEKYIELIASFLIALVLTIPINIAGAYATINSVSVKGKDNIEGYAKKKDALTFTVDVSIQNQKISKEQVILGSSPGIQFDTCKTTISNGSQCTLKFPKNGSEDFDQKAIPFTINLFKNDSTLDDSKPGIVVIDAKAPVISISVSKMIFSSQEEISIIYQATDFACDDVSCENKCVGIKSIEFSTINNSFKQSIKPNTTDCSISAELKIEPSKLRHGQNSILAKAIDRFDQASQDVSVTFEIDASGPEIAENSFEIIGKGISLSTFSTKKINVEASVNISENDLNLDSVIADLSSLNPSANLKDAKASCSLATQGLYKCKWTFELNPGTEGLKTIAINASDNLGNKAAKTVSKQLFLDDNGPVVASLATQSLDNGQSFGKPSGNTIRAVFDEASGLIADNTFLHIAQSKIKATQCVKESAWICLWENVALGSSESVTISIDSSTIDIFGNAAAQGDPITVLIDNKAPVLKNITLSPVGGATQAFPDIFKIGNKIAVVAELYEDSNVFAVADFSKFITNASVVAGNCQKGINSTICTWLTSSINLAASDTIIFNFTDSAGNFLIAKKELKTLGLDESEVPDFWTSTITCSPKTLDRQLGPLINQRMYRELKLKPKSDKPSTVFISVQDCVSQPQIVESFELLNAEAGSTTPIIKLVFRKDEYRIDNASVSCAINIFSKHSNTIDSNENLLTGGVTGTDNTVVTKNPEIENAEINVQFYNFPLGELGSSVEKQVKDEVKKAKETLKFIDDLKQIFEYAKKLCQAINIIYNLVVLYFIITLGIKQAEQKCHATVVLEASGACAIFYGIGTAQCGATEASSVAADSSKKLLNKFCDFVTCKQTFLWGDNVQNWINNLPGAAYIGPSKDGKGTVFDYIQGRRYGLKPLSYYMDPNNNLLVAIAFVCVPGIIYGLDKYRQIQCLYADCLQTAVAREGLPITACQDQKAYAMCKYVTGEIFALIPWTALFDHYTSIIKEALSNPFTAIGVGISLLCSSTCPIPADGGVAYKICRAARLFSLVGDAANNVKNIIDEGFEIRQDYCSRLEDIEIEEEE